jgi:hypothetical protein
MRAESPVFSVLWSVARVVGVGYDRPVRVVRGGLGGMFTRLGRLARDLLIRSRCLRESTDVSNGSVEGKQ